MSDKKMALITMDEYKRLVRRDTEFDQLESCGVDNWNGWGQYDSITGEDGEQEISDAVKECEESLFETSTTGGGGTGMDVGISLPTVGSHETNPFPSPPNVASGSLGGITLEPVGSHQTNPFEKQD